MIVDKIVIMVFLQLIRRCLVWIIRGYPCIHCHTELDIGFMYVFFFTSRDKVQFIWINALVAFTNSAFSLVCLNDIFFNFLHGDILSNQYALYYIFFITKKE